MSKRFHLGLFATAATSAIAVSGLAYAQQAAPNQLEEVTVTATRQSDTVNKVPLAVTAQTQRVMDQQGIKAIADLQSTVPSLQIGQLSPGVAFVAIRGIANTSTGAATTGFYLDDIPIQKRNVGGGVATNNGTPLPPLFDLDRVEVLRGPQGTLFGGGSEGGTVRYITPSPSLTKYSTYARAEASQTKDGGTGHDLGVAVGGPIVEDKLGFRVSAFSREVAGYLDYLDPYNPNTVTFKDANKETIGLVRAAVALKPTEDITLTAALLSSHDHSDSATSTYQYPAGAVVVPTACYNNSTVTPARPSTYPNAVAFGAACATAPGITFTRPGATYGPYPQLGVNKTLNTGGLLPSTTNLVLPSFTADFDGHGFTFKSITSFIKDQTKSTTAEATQISNVAINATQDGNAVPRGLALFAGYPDFSVGSGHFIAENDRYGMTQEFRFASDNEGPLTWVGGIFYSNMRTKSEYNTVYDLDRVAAQFVGLTTPQRYGVPAFETAPGIFNGFDHKDQHLKDTEIAAFGEANYWINPKLKLTTGLRVSRVRFDFSQVFYGPVNGFNTPTVANGGIASGSTQESPITPKFGLQYQMSSNDMIYASAAKGFRAGGINTILSPSICGNAFTALGITQNDIPSTYSSDTVWSYELGSKMRLFNNRMQVNADIYRIDWNDVQLNVNLGSGCGQPFTANAGTARSQGFEVESQVNLFGGLSANLAVSYDDAEYTRDAFAPKTTLKIASAGQKFTTPPWTVNVGARYDLALSDELRMYLRADYRFASSYKHTAAQIFGLSSFSPDAHPVDTTNVNLRGGVTRGDYDFNIFVNNLLDFDGGAVGGRRGGCALPAAGGTEACTTYSTYQPFQSVSRAFAPRQIGVQLVYRH